MFSSRPLVATPHRSTAAGTAPARVLVVLVAALTLVGIGLLLGSAAGSSWTALTAPGPAAVEDAIGLAAALSGAALSAWLGTGAVVALGDLLLGRRPSPGVPVALHAVVAAALGMGLGVGAIASPWALAAPAAAASTATTAVGTAAPGLPSPGRMSGSAAAAVPGGDGVDPGWRPQPPPAAPATTAAADPLVVTTPRPALVPRSDVVVQRGDTLWDIAARSLGRTATDAEIAAAWPKWHSANLDVVGDDPDLLLPGQRLRPPP